MKRLHIVLGISQLLLGLLFILNPTRGIPLALYEIAPLAIYALGFALMGVGVYQAKFKSDMFKSTLPLLAVVALTIFYALQNNVWYPVATYGLLWFLPNWLVWFPKGVMIRGSTFSNSRVVGLGLLFIWGMIMLNPNTAGLTRIYDFVDPIPYERWQQYNFFVGGLLLSSREWDFAMRQLFTAPILIFAVTITLAVLVGLYTPPAIVIPIALAVVMFTVAVGSDSDDS